jgi:hypothetical protein
MHFGQGRKSVHGGGSTRSALTFLFGSDAMSRAAGLSRSLDDLGA